MSERLGKIHFWPTMVGVYAIFIPMHAMGIVGMPRRYSQFHEVINGQEVMIYEFLRTTPGLVKMVTWAAILTAFAQLIFLYNFVYSIFRGRRAGENPWEATTLEWITPSPPPHDNFGGRVPVVYRGAYEYSVPGAPDDFVLQTTPDETEANAPPRREVSVQGQGDGSNGHG